METKELKIQVPKGYEIDKENSTFELIKFKYTKNCRIFIFILEHIKTIGYNNDW